MSNKDINTSSTTISFASDLPASKVESSEEKVRVIVEEAVKRNHDFLVTELTNKLKSLGGVLPATAAAVESSEEWIAVDSLSKLRSLVGGRFESLKARWQGSGFPLKRKKGDKISDYEINEDGWVELEGWIAKQGFTARRRESLPDRLFEIKKSKRL